MDVPDHNCHLRGAQIQARRDLHLKNQRPTMVSYRNPSNSSPGDLDLQEPQQRLYQRRGTSPHQENKHEPGRGRQPEYQLRIKFGPKEKLKFPGQPIF